MQTPSPHRRVLDLLKLERDEVWVAITYAAAVSLLSIATPLGVQFLVNTVAFGALLQPLVVLTLLVLVGLVFAGTLRALHAWAVERLQQRIFARASISLAERLPRVDVAALDGRHGPEIVNRFFDVVTIQKGAASLLVDGVALFLQMLVGLLLLAFYHPFLLAFDLILIASLAVIVIVLGRGATRTTMLESKKKYALAAWLQEILREPHAFKALSGRELARVRAETLTREYLEARRAHFRVVFRQVVGALALQAVASAALLGVGGWLVITRQLTLGQLVAAELVVSAVVAGMSKMGKLFEAYYDVVAAADKVGQIMDLETEPAATVEAPASQPGASVRATGVDIASTSGALRGVDVDLPRGARVVVQRRNGTGAALLADVLAGVRLPERGLLDVDGVDVRDVDRRAWRARAALVRGHELFAGTVADNVLFGAPVATRHDARRALEHVGAWEHVSQLEGGLDARVGTAGAGLAPDLALRLLLARVLLAEPRLLVLDGALDDVDDHTRTDVLRMLDARARACTVVVITSNPSLMAWGEHAYAVDGERFEKIAVPVKPEGSVGGGRAWLR